QGLSRALREHDPGWRGRRLPRARPATPLGIPRALAAAARRGDVRDHLPRDPRLRDGRVRYLPAGVRAAEVLVDVHGDGTGAPDPGARAARPLRPRDRLLVGRD